MRILLIEDDEVLVSVLLQSLTKQYYVVDVVQDGQMGWEYSQTTNYDLFLMDVEIPKLDGISLCQKLRQKGCTTPILLMTAKDASSDRIRGLDTGADDYLIKPLDLGELQARIRALLRRGEVPYTPVLEIERLRLDPSSCQVTYDGKQLELTPKEYSLLELLMRNPSRVYSRGDIIEHLWTFDDPPQEETVKSHIKWLRHKLKAVGAVDWIENVYGVGYRLNPQKAKQGRSIQNTLREAAPEASTKFKIQNWEEGGTDKGEISLTPNSSNLVNSPSVVQQFQQAMSGLWNQYQGAMTQRIDILKQASNALSSGNLTSELGQSAQQAAHKLAGVLGMFELDTGTEIAREIEVIFTQKGDLSTIQKHQLLSLIQQLGDLLNFAGEKTSHLSTSSVTPSSNSRLLLIEPDLQLGEKLQQLALAAGMLCEQIGTIEGVKNYLKTTSPDLVVLNVDEVGTREDSLTLLAELAVRTPPIPVIVLTAVDGLLDRVSIARAGGRGFLVKPVTAMQIWEIASQILQKHKNLAINVLVVDDDPLILAALRPMLEPWGMRMTGLAEPLRFWEVLEAIAPDLVILDVEMPEINGIELCQAVRTDPKWQGLPILFLTAHRQIETVQQVFAVGADDYVLKPVVGEELLTRIIHRLERNRLLQTFSLKDPITGLRHQPQCSRELQQMIEQAQKNRYPFCLVVLCVSEFRRINIQYGHETGNQILQRWSRVFQAAFRSGEVLGYWGNGEFIIGVSGLTKTEVNDRLCDILTTLRQQIFTAPNGDRFQAMYNFAVVEYPDDGLTIQSLYQVASTILS
ncbi:multi-component transcriptional regulator [Nostocales cyanobacterium HT-58-2]|nr:multi-component transcriptional regulator [Nostocales cyanobacterium HT-58-2]